MGNLRATDLAKLEIGKHADGDGLRFIATGGGKGRWELRFSVNGKRRDKGLGSYPKVNLSDARQKATALRAEATTGFDRVALRKGAQAPLQGAQGATVADLAPAFIEHHGATLRARDGGGAVSQSVQSAFCQRIRKAAR